MKELGWRLALLLLLVTFTAGCASRSAATPEPTPIGHCAIPPRTWADLDACEADPERLSLKIAESRHGKTIATIAVASKDPGDILAALGAFAVEWSTGADSFTVWAYSDAEAEDLGGYNRGVLFWNNDGPIEVGICTNWYDLDDGGPEVCAEEQTFAVSQR